MKFKVPPCIASDDIGFIFIRYNLHVQVDVNFAANLRVIVPVTITPELPEQLAQLPKQINIRNYQIESGTGDLNEHLREFNDFSAESARNEEETLGNDMPAPSAPVMTISSVSFNSCLLLPLPIDINASQIL